MGYSLKLSESLEEGVANIAQEQIDLALSTLEDPDMSVGERVHQMRRCCKRLRGLLRLVERALGQRFAREDRAIRDAAKLLSWYRDADVVLGVHRSLRSDGFARGALMTRWESRTNAHLLKLTNDPTHLRAMEAYALGLEQVWCRIGTWHLKGGATRIIRRGLATTYRRAQKNMNRARRKGTAGAFHSWRRHVKYHFYQMRLMRGAWPGVMRARAETADELGECLGEANDMAVYLDLIRREPVAPAEFNALQGEIRRRQRRLFERAWLLGDRLFHQSAETFGSDVAYLWRVAKRHKK